MQVIANACLKVVPERVSSTKPVPAQTQTLSVKYCFIIYALQMVVALPQEL
jgi:hypothetical protein